MIHFESRNIFLRNQSTFAPVVLFDPQKDRLAKMDFSGSNENLSGAVLEDLAGFSAWVNNEIEVAGARYGMGGYNELRSVYSRSSIFDGNKAFHEPRRLHLGVDIWAPAGTPVFAFMGGMIHSFAFNNHFGDYGATLILLHQLDGIPFYTLYGHISLKDIESLQEGQYVIRTQEIAHLGTPAENGHWPPHLHFQIIFDMGVYKGDYPGVCRYSEREKYLNNCPDPDLILQLNRYA